MYGGRVLPLFCAKVGSNTIGFTIAGALLLWNCVELIADWQS
jgi:hypothetical protein